MMPIEFIYFGVTLFAALALLINWKMRKDRTARRMSRGLRGYVAAKPVRAAVADDEEEETGLIVA
jgi:hypothetical protein